MKEEEYKNMAALDGTHWFFLGMKTIMLSVLDSAYRTPVRLNILDAGSGTCWFSHSLQKYGEVTALDINADALKVCRARGIAKCIEADIAEIPTPDNEFDLIACSEVLYHQYIKDDGAIMREFHRVLKPGGRVLVKVPAHMYLWGKHDAMNLTRHRYEPREVRKIFEDNGFIIERLTYANFFLFPFIYLKRKMQSSTKDEAESDVKETNPIMNTMLLAVLYTEALLLRFIDLPQGSSVICLGRKS
jgi:SAM-dependent methyltransferase